MANGREEMASLYRELLERLKSIRIERFGDAPAALDAMAKFCGLPAGTYENFEGGISIPLQALLPLMNRLQEEGVDLNWLMTGRHATS